MIRTTVSAPQALLAALLLTAAPLVGCSEDKGGTTTGDQDTTDLNDQELEESAPETENPEIAEEAPAEVEQPAETEGPAEEAPAEEPAETEEEAASAAQMCGDDFELDVPMQACFPEGPYGTSVGDTLANLEFFTCDGQPFAMKDLVGKAKAVLLTESAGWCTVCRAEVLRLEGLYKSYIDKGFVIVQTLYQDNAGARATGAFCNEWKNEYGLSYVVVFDPQHKTAPYHPKFATGELATPLNMILDKNLRIQSVVEGLYPGNLEPQVRAHLGEF